MKLALWWNGHYCNGHRLNDSIEEITSMKCPSMKNHREQVPVSFSALLLFIVLLQKLVENTQHLVFIFLVCNLLNIIYFALKTLWKCTMTSLIFYLAVFTIILSVKLVKLPNSIIYNNNAEYSGKNLHDLVIRMVVGSKPVLA